MGRKRSTEFRGFEERARWLFFGPSSGAASAAAVVLAAALLANAGVSSADKVIWKDGTEATGRVVSQDAKSVVLEMPKYGANVRLSIPTADIQAVVKDGGEAKAPAAPAPTSAPPPHEKRYYAQPILGEIG